MKIQHEETETKGAFFISDKTQRVAELTYSKAGTERIIIDHTEVSDLYRGKGFGKKLVYEAVNFARENQLKILPLCPYARSVFSRNRDLDDVT